MIKKKISKILVPLDGSENSVRGLETAITFSKKIAMQQLQVFTQFTYNHTQN